MYCMYKPVGPAQDVFSILYRYSHNQTVILVWYLLEAKSQKKRKKVFFDLTSEQKQSFDFRKFFLNYFQSMFCTPVVQLFSLARGNICFASQLLIGSYVPF